MEVNNHFMQMLLLSLMMVSASHAWHSRRICPDQRLPVGGDCSRHREFCPIGTVCQRFGHSHKCRIQAGDSGCGNDDDKCEINAKCFSDICRIPAGVGGCGNDSAKCVTTAVCESDTCKIMYGLNCTNNEDHCQRQGACVSGICGCTPLPDNHNGSFTSPNFPDFYGNYRQDVFNIIAPPGKVTKIEFAFFSMEMDGQCAIDRLETDCVNDNIKLLDLASGTRILCGTGCPEPFISTTASMAIFFNSDFQYSCRGIKIRYYFI